MRREVTIFQYRPSSKPDAIREADYEIRDEFRDLGRGHFFMEYYHSLIRAYDLIDENIRQITDFSRWNMGELQREGELSERDENLFFRRPRIVVDVGFGEHFGRGRNIEVHARSAEGYQRDFGNNRPLDVKVFQAEGFSSVIEQVIRGPRPGGWTVADLSVASKLAFLTADILDHVAVKLSCHCDVEIGDRLRLMVDDEKRSISSWVIVTSVESAEEREQARLAEEARRAQIKYEVAQRRQYRDDEAAAKKNLEDAAALERLDAFESTYGMSPEMFIGYIEAFKGRRLQYSAIAQILADQHGLRSGIWEGFAHKVSETRYSLLISERRHWPTLSDAEISRKQIISFGTDKGFQNKKHNPIFPDQPQDTLKP